MPQTETQYSNVVQGNYLDPNAAAPLFPWSSLQFVRFDANLATLRFSGVPNIPVERISSLFIQTSKTPDFAVVETETTFFGFEENFAEENYEKVLGVPEGQYGIWYFRAVAYLD